MFERFTDRARRVVVLAQEESRMLNHDRIGTEHLLLGLLREDGETARVLEQSGIDLATARRHLERSHGRGRRSPGGHIPFSARAKKSLELALVVSQRLGGTSIGTPHLLRALLDLPECTAFRMLTGFGVDTAELALVADRLAQNDRDAETFDSQHLRVTRAGRVRAAVVPGSDRPPAGEIAARISSLTDELLQRHEQLVAGLRRYGRHRDDCEPGNGNGCTCGLDGLLAAIDPASAPLQEPSA